MAEHGSGSEHVAIITGSGGVRFRADIGGHTVETDQPVRGGGADSAPTPLDLMPVALGSCIALYAHQFCVTRNIPDDDLRVEVRWSTLSGPKRIGRFDVRVILPDSLPAEYRTALERAVLTCPVHNTLTHAPAINVELLDAVVA